MNELTDGQQADASESVRLAEAAARAAEADARRAEAESQAEIARVKASAEGSGIVTKWEAISLIGVVLLIAIAIVLGKMIAAGVFN